MLITGTSDKIQFKLGSTAATELPFTVDYNNYTSTTITTKTNNGTSNDTTAVDLVPSPGSGEQNELKYCSIYNAESASETVIIQVYDGSNTRTVFQSVLGSGDVMQYQLEKGWEVIDSLGNKKTQIWDHFANTMNGAWGWRPSGIASATAITSTAVSMITLGRAEKSYTTINAIYNLAATASTLTYAEIGVYSGYRLNGDTALAFNRKGYVNVSTVWSGSTATTGVKSVSVPITGSILPGEQILLTMGYGGTGLQLRTLGWGPLSSTDINDSAFGSIGNNTNFRPSRQPFLYYGAYGQAMIYVNWQGI